MVGKGLMHSSSFISFADYVLDSLVQTGQLEEENREKVRMALLQRHKHQSSKTKEPENKFLRSIGDIGRISSAVRSMSHEGEGGEEGEARDGGGEGHRRKLFSGFPFSAPNLLGFASKHGSDTASTGSGRGNGGGSFLNIGRGSGSLEGSSSKLDSEGHSGSEDEVGKKARVRLTGLTRLC